ncbi:MAG: WD40 repeat domain-containing protein [Chloroflexi bacterium]|nr:WD40 repeat domain-containing protein [Chloroflexota bacterium]
MKIIRLMLVFASVTVLVSGLLAAVSGVAAQGDDEFTAVNTLLDQAQIALDGGDLATAQSLLFGASALLTPDLQATCNTLPGARNLIDQAAIAPDAPAASTLLSSARTLIDSCNGTVGGSETAPAPVTENTMISISNASQVQELNVLTGHTAWIREVAWSPDGTRLASASGDQTVRVWDTATGEQITVFEGHTASVSGVAWSPDGTQLASSSADQTVRVWDVASGTQRVVLEGHPYSVTSVVWSPDGTRLASTDFEFTTSHTVRLWDAASGTALAVLEGHTAGILKVAWSPDGARLATAADDNTVRLWDAASGEPLALFEGHDGRVYSVKWSPDGTRLASASADTTVRVWDAATGTEIVTVQGHTNVVFDVAWSPDGTLLASASEDETVRLWNAESGEELAVLDTHTNWVYGVAWSPDGSLLASGADDDTVRLWGLPEAAEGGEATGPSLESAPEPSAESGIPVAMIGENQGETTPGESQTWSYTGQAGELLTLTTVAEWDTTLTLLLDGEEIAFNDDGEDVPGLASQIIVTLPETGVYSIVVDSFLSVSGGEYILLVETGPLADEAPIEPEEPTEPEDPIAGGETIPFSTTMFSFDYPADLELEPLPNEEGNSVTFGTSPAGWIWPALNISVEGEEENRGQWGVKIFFIDFGMTPESPVIMLNAVLDEGFREGNPDTIFSNVRPDAIGPIDVAYVDYVGEGKRLIMFNPGGTYVGAVLLFAHPDEVEDQYAVIQPIIASIELQ